VIDLHWRAGAFSEGEGRSVSSGFKLSKMNQAVKLGFTYGRFLVLISVGTSLTLVETFRGFFSL
jgi:hypothetical protein